MQKRTATIIAMLALATIASSVHAVPLLTLTFKIDNVYPTVGSTANPIPINSTTYDSNGVPVDIQIEVDAKISGLSPGTSLGAILFNVDLGNSAISHPTTPNYSWKPNNLQWIDDQGNSNSFFSINEDSGLSTTDLIGVAAAISNGPSTDFNFGGDPADPRLTLGETGSPFQSLKLGTFRVTYNASSSQSTIGAINDPILGFTTLQDDSLLYNPTSQNIVVNPANVFLSAPEPSALALLAASTLALLNRRRWS